MPSLSIIVASSGRPTLARTLGSVQPQLAEHDEILVSINHDCPWGHQARNQLMACARGDYLLWTDDDDMVVLGALDLVREAVSIAPDRVHIWKMMYANGQMLWQEPIVREGNVSTQMFAVPNIPGRLGVWGDRYQGDLDFLVSTLALHDQEPLWHPEIIAHYRPAE